MLRYICPPLCVEAIILCIDRYFINHSLIIRSKSLHKQLVSEIDLYDSGELGSLPVMGMKDLVQDDLVQVLWKKESWKNLLYISTRCSLALRGICFNILLSMPSSPV